MGCSEVEAEAKKNHRQLQQALEAMDKGNIEKRVLEEDLNELEREKVMLEYELDNAGAKHKADLRNLEIQLASAKDNESDLMQRIDLMNKDTEELERKVRGQQDEIDDLQTELNNKGGSGSGSGHDALEQVQAELAKTQKLLSTEKLLKQQAVNKLAEIMNRKDIFLNQDK